MASRKGDAHGQVNPKTGLTPRQELFAQYIVAGYTLADATKSAGYRAAFKDSVTSKDQSVRWAARGAKLRKNPNVAKRIQELTEAQMEDLNNQRGKLSEKFQVNLERLTQMLMEDREFARTGKLTLPGDLSHEKHMRYEPRTGALTEGANNGPQTSAWKPDARAAVQATMGLAKLHGLLVDRAEITVAQSMQRMSNVELVEFIRKLHAEVGPMVDLTPSVPGSRVYGSPSLAPPALARTGFDDDDER